MTEAREAKKEIEMVISRIELATFEFKKRYLTPLY